MQIESGWGWWCGRTLFRLDRRDSSSEVERSSSISCIIVPFALPPSEPPPGMEIDVISHASNYHLSLSANRPGPTGDDHVEDRSGLVFNGRGRYLRSPIHLSDRQGALQRTSDHASQGKPWPCRHSWEATVRALITARELESFLGPKTSYAQRFFVCLPRSGTVGTRGLPEMVRFPLSLACASFSSWASIPMVTQIQMLTVRCC